MSLKHGILGLLNYGSMTGYELMKVFEDSLVFFWKAQTSQIYRELDTIEKKGWVTSEMVIQQDKPNKKIFTVTEEGKKEFLRWLNEHSPHKTMQYRDELTMRMYFSASGDKEKLVKELELYASLNEEFYCRLEGVEKTIAHYADKVENPEEPLYWRMAIMRGLFNAEGNIKWVNACLKLLEDEKEL